MLFSQHVMLPKPVQSWPVVFVKFRDKDSMSHYNIEYNIYMAYMFDRNLGEKASQIEGFESNLRSFGYFECSAVLLFFLDPSCKGTLLVHTMVGRLRSRLSNGTQNRAFANNGSCIQMKRYLLIGVLEWRRFTFLFNKGGCFSDGGFIFKWRGCAPWGFDGFDVIIWMKTDSNFWLWYILRLFFTL